VKDTPSLIVDKKEDDKIKTGKVTNMGSKIQKQYTTQNPEGRDLNE
jgi:hypothetical protein